MNKKTHEIKMVSADGVKSFNESLQKHWEAGWELVGELKISKSTCHDDSRYHDGRDATTYAQMMCKLR